mmetsp:Transcript_2722/g.7471  ORF Transcript_2722/g.7471 Transcript_2722/m.7471 type:complete len:188 (+) Transcript_2722:56-619(+)
MSAEAAGAAAPAAPPAGKGDGEDVTTSAAKASATEAGEKPIYHWVNGKAVPLVIEESDDEEPPRDPYYWEDDYPTPVGEVPVGTRLTHTAHWTGVKVFEGMEFAGEMLAEFFGLNKSKFQWVIDQVEREKEEARQRELEDAQRAELKRLEAEEEAAAADASLEEGGAVEGESAGAGAGAGSGAKPDA